jgi:PAS domain S-box-containing protein
MPAPKNATGSRPDALHILESVTDGVHVFDSQSRIILINEPARKLHRERGINPDELVGKVVFAECYPEMRSDSWGRAFQKVQAERVPVEAEYYFSPWRKWYLSRFFPLAEGGAVVFCSDITEKKIGRQHLQISHGVATALGDAESLEAAAPKILGAVCEAMDAEIAALWRVNPRPNHLECLHAVACNQNREGEFLRRTRELKLICGEGLPGRAWQEQRPIWIPDVTVDSNFPRAREAAAEHLYGAFAFPIMLENRCLGVLEFFLGQIREPDAALLKLLEVVALQIAQFKARKRSERAFKESEDRFQMMANNISQLAWTAEPGGSIEWYNRRWFDYTGTTLEEMRGWGWTKVHHPDHVNRVVERIQQSWATGVPWEDTFPLRGRDGRYRWFLSRALPIRNERGEITQWFGTNTDVTELQETQEALRASEQRFRAMADACTALIWHAQSPTDWAWFNRAWLEFVGAELRAEVGERWVRHVHPEDLEQCLAALKRTYVLGEALEVEFRLQRHDGEYRWMLARSAGCEHGLQKQKGFVGCCLDITESRNKTEELERLVAERTAKLRQSIHDLEILSYGIIHDLRAPLRSMHSWSEFLLEEMSEHSSAEARACIDRILASSRRMDQLVQDVVAYGRVLRTEERFAPVETEELLAGIIDSYPELSDRRESIEVVTPLPRVVGTEAALTQCLSNLLRNAVKFVPAGRIPRVRIGAQEISLSEFSFNDTSFSPAGAIRHGMVRIWVEDNGIGVPREHWGRIFQMFQRLDQNYEGTGIGLSIVQKTIERLGGRVGLESEVGKGSRFWVDLPLAERTDGTQQTASCSLASSIAEAAAL